MGKVQPVGQFEMNADALPVSTRQRNRMSLGEYIFTYYGGISIGEMDGRGILPPRPYRDNIVIMPTEGGQILGCHKRGRTSHDVAILEANPAILLYASPAQAIFAVDNLEIWLFYENTMDIQRPKQEWEGHYGLQNSLVKDLENYGVTPSMPRLVEVTPTAVITDIFVGRFG